MGESTAKTSLWCDIIKNWSLVGDLAVNTSLCHSIIDNWPFKMDIVPAGATDCDLACMSVGVPIAHVEEKVVGAAGNDLDLGIAKLQEFIPTSRCPAKQNVVVCALFYEHSKSYEFLALVELLARRIPVKDRAPVPVESPVPREHAVQVEHPASIKHSVRVESSGDRFAAPY